MTQTAPLSTEEIRAFVLAGHGDLDKVKALLAARPDLLNVPYQWAENDYETAIGAAAHVGNAPIAEYLLAQGAPLEICTAAMLGRQEDVAGFIQADPAQIDAVGAHRIPLLTHAALSGNLALVQWLVERGARAGISAALYSAVARGYDDLTRWLLEHGEPDLTWTNFQGKTALVAAQERGATAIVELLQAHGAVA